MANKTIGELPEATTPLNGDELMHGVQGGNSRRMTVDHVRGPKLKSLVDLATAAGDLIYGLGTGLLARLPKGTAGQVLQMNSGATAPEWVTLPITKEFVSAEQTITVGGLLTLAHGLGAKPKIVQVTMICKTAELGYSVGDEAVMNNAMSGDADSRGLTIVPGTSNIDVRIGSSSIPLRILAKNTGTMSSPVFGNWRLIVRAWA